MAAKNTPEAVKPRGKGTPFKAGQSGNPRGRAKGVPNRITRTVKEAFEHAFTDAQADPKHPSNLNAFSRKFPKEFMVAVAKLIPETILGNFQIQGSAKKMTDDELASVAGQQAIRVSAIARKAKSG